MTLMSDLLGIVAFLAICVIAAVFPHLFDVALIAVVIGLVVVAAVRKGKEQHGRKDHPRR